ncbi:MAG: hypothetical protein RIT28_2517 [Pseudomonadota bacterium]
MRLAPTALLLGALVVLHGCKGASGDQDSGVDAALGALTVSGATLDFGQVTLHDTATRTLSYFNGGAGPLTIFDVQLDDDSTRPHWSVVGGGPATLESGLGVELTILLTPLSLADPSTKLVILSDDPDAPRAEVSLRAEVVGVPRLQVSSELLDFGTVLLGASAELDILLANTGSDTLQIQTVGFQSGGQGAFSLLVNPAGSTLAPGAQNGLITVKFAPTGAGSVNERLIVSTNDPETPELGIVLMGAGSPP